MKSGPDFAFTPFPRGTYLSEALEDAIDALWMDEQVEMSMSATCDGAIRVLLNSGTVLISTHHLAVDIGLLQPWV